MKNYYISEFSELILLAILLLNNDAYGVPIAEAIEKATDKRVSTGALYTALSSLQRKGYVKPRMGERTKQRGGRAKMYFNVTDAGRNILADMNRIRQKLS